MNDWTWRDHVARWFHRIGYKFSPEVCQEVFIRDADGNEIFNITFGGGFVASVNPSHSSTRFSVHSRHFADDDDEVGTVEDWD